jgi:TPR repeat protein
MTEPDQLARCASHGLHFDVTRSDGCVLCRRASKSPQGQGGPKLGLWVGGIGTTLALACLALALKYRHPSGETSPPSPNTDLSAASPGAAGVSHFQATRGVPPVGSVGVSEQAAREAISRIANAQVACSTGSEDGCLHLARECAALGLDPGGLPPLMIASRQLDLALRRACQRAAQTVRPSCDPALGQGCRPTSRLKDEALEKCRTGTIDDCGRYAEVYSRPESFDSQLRAQLVQEACKKGSASNCARLSDILAVGDGLPNDPGRALELHDRETAAGLDALKKCEGPGCAIAQLAYEARGEMMEQKRRAEIEPNAVARECEAGKLPACEGLREAYSAGSSRLSLDPAKANAFGAKANEIVDRQCRAGDRDACSTLVRYLLYSPPQDVARGRRIADEACAKGNYGVCWMVGDFLARPGPNHDSAAANGYFSRGVTLGAPSCSAGELAACQLLLEAYRLGRGVAPDVKKYEEYFEKVYGAATPH